LSPNLNSIFLQGTSGSAGIIPAIHIIFRGGCNKWMLSIKYYKFSINVWFLIKNKYSFTFWEEIKIISTVL
jgi:hypothetical protein